MFPVQSSLWSAWKLREPGILPDPKDGKREIVRCRGASERERRRVSGREVGFGLTQRLFRAPWRWSGRDPWSPQRRWGRPYRPQINYHLSGTGNQSPFYGNSWRSQCPRRGYPRECFVSGSGAGEPRYPNGRWFFVAVPVGFEPAFSP